MFSWRAMVLLMPPLAGLLVWAAIELGPGIAGAVLGLRPSIGMALVVSAATAVTIGLVLNYNRWRQALTMEGSRKATAPVPVYSFGTADQTLDQVWRSPLLKPFKAAAVLARFPAEAATRLTARTSEAPLTLTTSLLSGKEMDAAYRVGQAESSLVSRALSEADRVVRDSFGTMPQLELIVAGISETGGTTGIRTIALNESSLMRHGEVPKLAIVYYRPTSTVEEVEA